MRRLWLALILLLTFAVYSPSVANDFTFDGRFYAMAVADEGPNPMVRELHPFWEYFQVPMGHGYLPGRSFRPITVYSYALTHSLFRRPIPSEVREEGTVGTWTDPPWPHHLLNVLLHVLATWLVYRMTVRLLGVGFPALVATVVFGLHALRSNVVASIVGRGELLAFVFGALALLQYVAALDQKQQGTRWGRLGLVALFLFLACSSKENGVAWVAFLPVFVLAQGLGRGPGPGTGLRSLLELQVKPFLLCLLPVLGIYLVLRASMLAEHAGDFYVPYSSNPIFGAPWDVRVPTGAVAFGYGFYKVFLPFHLNSDYGPQVIRVVESWADHRLWTALLCLLGVLAGGLIWARRHPLPFLAVAVFFGFGFVTSNIPVPVETMFAERSYYAPGLGLSFLLAWVATYGAAGPRGKIWRWGLAVPLGLWLVVCAGLCVKRSLDWHDNDRLFRTDAETQPRSIGLLSRVGFRCWLAKDVAGYRRYLLEALDVDPEAVLVLSDMASQSLQEGNLQAAEHYARRGLRSPQIWLRRDGAELHYVLSRVLAQRGRLEETEKHLWQGLKCDPSHLRSRQDLVAIFQGGRNDAVLLQLLDDGDRFSRNDPFLGMHRGLLAYRQKRIELAAAILERSLPRLQEDRQSAPGWLAFAHCLGLLGRADAGIAITNRFLARRDLPPSLHGEFTGLAQDLRGM